MGWEWVAPVCTGAVGIAGIVGTWYTGKQSRDQAVETLREQLGHDRLQAREEREQERLAKAYLELLKMTEQVGHWTQFVYPVVEDGPPPRVPMPTAEVQADAAALVAAFGTEEVRKLVETWEAIVNMMIHQAELVEYDERTPMRPGDSSDPRWQRPAENHPRAALWRLRPKEKEAREKLGAQVRSELEFGYRGTRLASGVTRTYTNPG